MISDKAVQEFKEIFEKKESKEISWQEASEMAHNLYNYVKLIMELAEKDEARKRRLIDEPKGFHLDGDFSCAICGHSASGENSWYDKHGIKCMTCQKAISKKVLPGSVASNKGSWYSSYDLESRFNMNRHIVKKYVKAGILKARTILNDTGHQHYQLFLIKDNKDTLPPKKLTESQLVKETHDGKDWYHSEPWYKFVDPLEVLKDYKLINYFQVTEK